MFVTLSVTRVRAYRESQGWSNNRLAKEAQVSESVVRRIDLPEWSCTLANLRKLEGIVPGDFMPPALSAEAN
ncbi:MAG: hypothetical protein RLY86_114 [Pseudomonadota bacterium]|jgi:ribosome-binding protein aMBF1 (putative translation factor)